MKERFGKNKPQTESIARVFFGCGFVSPVAKQGLVGLVVEKHPQSSTNH